jgi:hypothetical protein
MSVNSAVVSGEGKSRLLKEEVRGDEEPPLVIARKVTHTLKE